MRFMILGRTELCVDQRKVYLGSAKQRGLLAMLLYQTGKPVSIDLIVDELWSGSPRDAIRSSLYQLVSRIRRVLKDHGVPATALSATADGYRLDLDQDLVDFHLFKRLVQEAEVAAQAGKDRDAVRLLTDAIGLWRDTPLADLKGNWSERKRRHMKEVFWLGAYKNLFDALLRLGEHRNVLAALEPLLDEHGLDDTLARQRMIALVGAGRGAEVPRFFMDFRRRWMRELGSEPGREAHDTYRRIIDTSYEPRQDRPPPPYPLRDIHDFTGREDLLNRLDMVLIGPASGGVVIIDGMPGVGKTTLATHWVHQHRDQFPHGQLHLDLHGYGPAPPMEVGDALGQILRGLGVQNDGIPSSAEQRRQQVARLLTGRRTLLVVENARDAHQVRPLLEATTDCAVLITSRNRLKGLIREGVHHITLQPLSREKSTSLLKGMIEQQSHEDDDSDALQALAELSGGLPLALRIIGQHAAERPRTRLIDVVGQLRRQLLARRRDLDDEEVGVWTAFMHSYRTLPAQAAQTFRTLSLHPGVSMSLGSAAALCGYGEYQTELDLEFLTRANLLEHDSAERYRFHDLLRQFAADCAREEDPSAHRRAAIERMLDWYLLCAVSAARLLCPKRRPVPDLPTGTKIKPLMFDNESVAIRWCQAERMNLTAATRCAAEYGFDNHAWQIPGTLHDIFERFGCQDDVLECNKIALAAARRTQHPDALVGTLIHLGVAFHSRREYGQASALQKEAIQVAGALGHREGEAVAMHNLANIHIKHNDYDTALTLYQRALEISRDIGNLRGVACSLHRLGKAYRHLRRHTESLRFHRDALALRERIGDRRGQGITHAEMAALYLALEEYELVLKHAERALELSAEAMDQATTCDALITKAGTELRYGHTALAVSSARHAVEICRSTRDTGRHVRALDVLAEALAASGDERQAKEVWLEELQMMDESDPRRPTIRDHLT